MTIRGDILRRGVEITEGSRNEAYGDPVTNLGLAGELKALCRSYAIPGNMTHAEVEAIDLVLTKVARVYTGRKRGKDTYTDGATYFAIAYEVSEVGQKEAATKREENLAKVVEQTFNPMEQELKPMEHPATEKMPPPPPPKMKLF